MRKIQVFNSVSLDGFFTDAMNDMSWAHKRDPEWNAFVGSNAGGNAALLFGRVTYEMIQAFWPTPPAAQTMPEVAAGMNRLPKYVVSRTLNAVDWHNTTLLRGEAVATVRMPKGQPGPNLVVLGREPGVAAHRGAAHQRLSAGGEPCRPWPGPDALLLCRRAPEPHPDEDRGV